MGNTFLLKNEKKPYFTEKHCKNKTLVIQMLECENEYIKTQEAKQMYRSYKGNLLYAFYSMHRYVLNHFGFNTSDKSVMNYRKIFKTYYNSYNDYDPDVINSVFYMKHNKCMFYNAPIIGIGQYIINVPLLTLYNEKTTLLDEINKIHFKYLFIGAFSMS
jgi:hypothetical protein